jgi:hypothetical protein
MNANAQPTEAHVVNGLNVDDLLTLVEDVRRDASKAATRWRVATAWMGQAHSRSEVEGFSIGGEQVPRRFTIDIDEPCELGGSNRFANPQEHLIAALNACMTVGYVVQCAVRGITLQSLEIETDGDIDLRGFLGLDPRIANGYEVCVSPFVSEEMAPGSNSHKCMTRSWRRLRTSITLRMRLG